jgi:D-arginine dehydrogenase
VENVDFVVVGGGIAGASAAFELAARGTVILCEREQIAGYHTTGRSAALFTESYERGPVRALTMEGRSFLESPPEEFGGAPLLSPLPVLYIARQDQRAALAELEAATRDRVPLTAVTGDELVELCPVIRRPQITAGLLEPDSMEIDVHALHQGFLRGIARRGGRVLTAAPVTALANAATGWQVRAGEHRISCEVVVNAAGAWCDEVAALANVAPLRLQPFRRTAFTFGPEGHDLAGWPMVVDVDEAFYFKPERTQLMGSLAEETPLPPHDVRPEEIDVARAVERITAATTFEIRHVRRTWAGLRTFAPDRLPVVGFEPGRDGFFWLGGQGGYGIMTSPALARTAAGLVCDGAVPGDLVAAGVDRSLIAPDRLRG